MARIVFLTSYPDDRISSLLPLLGDYCVARTMDELLAAKGDILLLHGTSVIVPQAVLDRFKYAYNVHSASPASPAYPGRDPHHFAIYDGATRYGSTCHVMTDRVDAGPIVYVEWFDVEPNEAPSRLLHRADVASVKVIKLIAPKLREGEALTLSGDQWGKRKTTRGDFVAMCKLPLDISKDELERRKRAFNTERYKNLVVEIHGNIFRIEA